MALIGYILDGVLLVLLIAAILIGIRVQRRLSEVRRAQDELADLVDQLDRATEKARTAVGQLREAGAEARTILTGEMGKARALADELSLIVEAGDNLANRLEQKLAQTGQEARARAGGAQTASSEKDTDAGAQGRDADPGQGHRAILAALKDTR